MINGIDDFLAEQGPDVALELFENPEEPSVGRQSQAQLLVGLAQHVQLRHTTDGEAYARLPVGDHHETWLLRSKSFRRWLGMQFFQAHGKPPGAQSLQDAIGLLEAKAQFDSPEGCLFVRVAGHQGHIYMDLGDDQWRAIEIGPAGWRVTTDPPVHFRRTRGMRALPQPVRGGSLGMLRRFINIGTDSNWILCAAWLLAACRPQGPYPLLILQGEQGTAKSTTEKFLRRIIDPSKALVRTPPREERDLLIAANNSWVIAYDNLSGIPQWLSDSLCRLATGGGFSTRELYTNAEEVFFDAMRPVILNGIDHLAERADLAGRALILHLPCIEDSHRKDEEQLYADFDENLPLIFGALLSAVSAALARAPHIRLEHKPRMADFALWASAGESQLGFEEGSFMNTYAGNRADAVEETLEADPVGAALLLWMENEAVEWWEGTSKELQECLEKLVNEKVRKTSQWPKSPRGLAGCLRRLATFLREYGIDITFLPKGTKGKRTMTISRTLRNLSAATATIATPCEPHTFDQSVATYPTGGGSSSGGAVDSISGSQPPPESDSAIHLDQFRVAAECGGGGDGGGHIHNRSGETPDDDPVYRIHLCRRCGPVDWQWVDLTWKCPRCGERARGRQPDSESVAVEHFEI